MNRAANDTASARPASTSAFPVPASYPWLATSRPPNSLRAGPRPRRPAVRPAGRGRAAQVQVAQPALAQRGDDVVVGGQGLFVGGERVVIRPRPGPGLVPDRPVRRQPHPDPRRPVPGRGHRVGDLPQQPAAIGAVTAGAAVQPRVQELRQQVRAVGGDLHAVESGPARVSEERPHVPEVRHHPFRRSAAVMAVGGPVPAQNPVPRVPELERDPAAHGVHHAGDLVPGRDLGRGVDPGHVRVTPHGLRADPGALGHDQSGAGPLGVVGRVQAGHGQLARVGAGTGSPAPSPPGWAVSRPPRVTGRSSGREVARLVTLLVVDHC